MATTTTADTGLYCTRCGSGGAVLLHQTIDPRYPLIACPTCKHRSPGVTDQGQATADALAFARKVHPDHRDRNAVKDWCSFCRAEAVHTSTGPTLLQDRVRGRT